MRMTRFVGFMSMLVAVALSCTAFSQEKPAGQSAGVNLAVVAKPSSSYVSGDTTPHGPQ